MNPLDVLLLSPKQFGRKPQIGAPHLVPWGGLAALLSEPVIGNAKDAAGAWSPALYRGNIRRKANLVHVHALVVDIDGAGDVRRVANVLSKYRAIVHSTFSSTDETPRCRVVLPLVEPIDADNYEKVHAIVRVHLRAPGFVVDDGAKDASRLSFMPVIPEGSVYRFRLLEGQPLDARAIITAQPTSPPKAKPKPVRAPHRGSYARAALACGGDAVANASPGERHHALCREAYSLARLAVPEHAIVDALLGSFVCSAGERRTREGQRTIADAIRARRGSP